MPDFHHLQHDFKLWQLNLRLSRHLRGPFRREEDGFIYASGALRYLKDVEKLHMQLFRKPLLGWLTWVYRFRAAQLMTLLLSPSGELVGYSLCMFNAAEASEHIVHEVYVGIAPTYQGRGLSIKLRRAVAESYNHGHLSAISTLAGVDDIKALRSAQKAGYAITKFSAKPPAHYLVHPLTRRF